MSDFITLARQMFDAVGLHNAANQESDAAHGSAVEALAKIREVRGADELYTQASAEGKVQFNKNDVRQWLAHRAPADLDEALKTQLDNIKAIDRRAGELGISAKKASQALSDHLGADKIWVSKDEKGLDIFHLDYIESQKKEGDRVISKVMGSLEIPAADFTPQGLLKFRDHPALKESPIWNESAFAEALGKGVENAAHAVESVSKEPKSLYMQSHQKLASLPAESMEASALRKLRHDAWVQAIKPHTLGENKGWVPIVAYEQQSETLAKELSEYMARMSDPEKKLAQEKLAFLVSQLDRGIDIEKLRPHPGILEVDLATATRLIKNRLAPIADNYLVEAEKLAFKGTSNAELKTHLEQAAKGDFAAILKKYEGIEAVAATAASDGSKVLQEQAAAETHLPEEPAAARTGKSAEPAPQPAGNEPPKEPPLESTGGQLLKDGEKGATTDAAKATEHTVEKGMWRKFADMHWGKKTAIIGGTVAVAGGIGYWALKEDKKDEKPQTQEATR